MSQWNQGLIGLGELKVPSLGEAVDGFLLLPGKLQPAFRRRGLEYGG